MAIINDECSYRILVCHRFFSVKEGHIKFAKWGRISIHKTISKDKKYVRGKIYLKNADDADLIYQIYEIENLHIVDKNKQCQIGKDYNIFIPK